MEESKLRKLIFNLIKEEFETKEKEFTLPEFQIIEILKGYIEAALWTEEENLKEGQFEEDEDDEPTEMEKLIRLTNNFHNKSTKDFSDEDIESNSKIQAYLDIKKFISLAGGQAINEVLNSNGPEYLGHDIWLTRNHHGVGFSDRDYMFDDELEEAARQLKEVDLYISDDNQLVFSNAH